MAALPQNPGGGAGDDDDDKPKKHTLDTLFRVYANHSINVLQYETTVYDEILLSQIDCWLDEAKLFKTVFSRTDTGLTYMRFRKWRLSFSDFLEFLETICKLRQQNVEVVKEALVNAGYPGIVPTNFVVVK